MRHSPVVILGCGYTGSRVAARLLERGFEVIATTRLAAALESLRARGARILALDANIPGAAGQILRATPQGSLLLHSVPVFRRGCGWEDPTPQLLEPLAGVVRRVVYLSSTSVYGDGHMVGEGTPVAPRSARERLRVQAESHVRCGPWTSMILRPAAIYGAWRGVHASMRAGKYVLIGEGANYISRIHADDLAAHAVAALLSDLQGEWPVADEHPCMAREVAEFCSRLLNIPMPPSVPRPPEEDTRRADRRVDGGAVRRALGLTLRYPSYLTGIPAALEEERAEPAIK